MGEFDPSSSSSADGKAASESLSCELCGSPISPGTHRCTICGHEVSESKQTAASTLPDWWKWVAVGAVTIAVLAGFLLSPKDSAPLPAAPVEEVKTAIPEKAPTRRPPPRAAVSIAEAAVPVEKQQPEPESAWKRQTDTSPLDDSMTIYFDLEGEEAIQGPRGRIVTPVLSFVCAQGKLEGYVITGFAAKRERRRDFASVRIRFDNGEAEDVRMVRSTQDKALFFENPAALVKRILNNQQLVFGFTPAGSGLAVTTFRLYGLRAELDPFRTECGLEDLFVSESVVDQAAPNADPL